MKKVFYFCFVVYLGLLLFTRFYNIEKTAHFTEDESGFIVRVHQIYKERKITLVGQINELGTKVFSSLSIYLLLPFAVIGKFDPTSVFFGAAFWGVLTSLTLFVLGKKINKELIIPIALITIFWFPLLQIGRWAWNPNFIPFWIGLGLFFYLQKKSIYYFFSGIFLGLSIHQHYYAIFVVFIFALIITIKSLLNKEIKKALLLDLGILITLIPFIIFDLRHPPGIFLLGTFNQTQNIQKTSFENNLFNYSWLTLKYYAQSTVLAVLLAIGIIGLFFRDLQQKNKALIYFIPCLFQIAMVAIVAQYSFHYFLPIIPFFLVWIIYPRKKSEKLISLAIMSVLLIGSALAFIPYLKNSSVEPNLTVVKKIKNILETQIIAANLKNVNVAVLSSPDKNTTGRKYRDLLLIPNNLQILAKEEYFKTENLFVVSTAKEEILRKDPAYELDNSRDSKIVNTWKVDNWIIYQFSQKK